jgi:RHS repeat-associated protein
VRYYNHGGTVVASRTATAALTWHTDDHHGTAQLAVAAGNLAVQRRKQTPFGQDRGTPPAAWPVERGFVGGTNDPTALVHLGAREYDPGIGRFISVDPVQDMADPQQWNGYAYANNNPTTHADPSGTCIPELCNAVIKGEMTHDPVTGKPKRPIRRGADRPPRRTEADHTGHHRQALLQDPKWLVQWRSQLG